MIGIEIKSLYCQSDILFSRFLFKTHGMTWHVAQAKGQGVYGKWEEDQTFYPCRVSNVHADNTYTVVFDDGVKIVLQREDIIVCWPGYGMDAMVKGRRGGLGCQILLLLFHVDVF